MLQEAQALDVIDNDSNNLATEKMAIAKKKEKEIEESRKNILAPHKEFTDAVNRLSKEVQEPLKNIVTILKTKTTSYITKLELERRKQEEAQRKAAIEIQKKIDEEAKLSNVVAPQVVMPVMPEVKTVTRTESGTAYIHREWTHEIVDANQVPREYLVVDERLIRTAVKNGVRQIPGCRIFEKTETRIRT
jgi:light-regulated signal transduction histidine kinase (bacteriophytochrome)